MHENARARFDLTGRIALVTGASRGIGREIATALAEHGAFVWLGGRDMERLDTVAAGLTSAGLGAAPLAFDVTNATSTTDAVALAIAERGPIDILVNNAGIQHRRPLAEWTDEDWRRVIDNNLTACFRLARLLAPGMIERGWGRIVSTGSVTGLRGRATIHAYVAAKAGLHGLTMSLAAELGASGVTANAIAPGYTATEINAALLNDQAFTERVRSRTPVGRWADPKEMAGAVVFLASPAASYVNGHILVVDGGLTTSL